MWVFAFWYISLECIIICHNLKNTFPFRFQVTCQNFSHFRIWSSLIRQVTSLKVQFHIPLFTMCRTKMTQKDKKIICQVIYYFFFFFAVNHPVVVSLFKTLFDHCTLNVTAVHNCKSISSWMNDIIFVKGINLSRSSMHAWNKASVGSCLCSIPLSQNPLSHTIDFSQ